MNLGGRRRGRRRPRVLKEEEEERGGLWFKIFLDMGGRSRGSRKRPRELSVSFSLFFSFYNCQ